MAAGREPLFRLGVSSAAKNTRRGIRIRSVSEMVKWYRREASMGIHTVKFVAAIVLIAGALPVMAAGDVAPEIHEICLKAADYRGCVEAQKGTPE